MNENETAPLVIPTFFILEVIHTIGIDFFLNGLHFQYAIHLHLLMPKKRHFQNALFLKAF